MKNFISMFLMTSLLLGGMTFTIGKMSVCAASKNRIEIAQQNRRIFSAAPKTNLPPPTRILLRPWTISFTATFIPLVS